MNSAPLLPDIALSPDPLNVPAAIARVACPDAGGIDLFLGITRAQQSPTEGNLAALEYHAYPEMALKEIAKLLHQARSRWPICRAVLWHRVGSVPLGQASVLIAVSTPHRAEAFAACQFLIDELKKLVPIWKKEIFAQSARWQDA